MKKRAAHLFFTLCLLIFAGGYAQKKNISLENYSYEELEMAINGRNEPDFVKPYLNAYLKKAKKEGNTEKRRDGYLYFLYATTQENELKYADSLMLCAKKINTNLALGEAYGAIGDIHYSRKDYPKALDNYINANNHAQKTSDAYLKNKVKYGIGNIKFYLGFYDESLAIFKECAAYFKGNDPKGYINCLQSIGICYNKLGKYDLSTEYNDQAIAEAKKINDTLSIRYSEYFEGINDYSKKNYTASIEQINNGLPTIKKLGDISAETVACFYLGKNYLATGNTDKAFGYFKKVDDAFNTEQYTRPDLRENYEILINNAKSTGNIRSQLYYVNQLMAVDSVLNTNFKYLSGKVYKEYDTKALIAEKKRIEGELAQRKTLLIIMYSAIIILFIASMFLLYRYFKNQRTYKQRFEDLMTGLNTFPEKVIAVPVTNIENEVVPEAESNEVETNTTITTEPLLKELIVNSELQSAEIQPQAEENKKPDINPEVVAAILKQLDRFEQKNKFLQKDLTLSDLAVAFSTNANYMSKIINYYKGKNYSIYLNDLRVDYIITLLKDKPRFRNFTIKALAEEAGFTNPQHFSKAFFARTGIYPSFFVSELSKEYGNKAVA